MRNCKNVMAIVMAGFCILSSHTLINDQVFASTDIESSFSDDEYIVSEDEKFSKELKEIDDSYIRIGDSEKEVLRKSIDNINISNANIAVLNYYYDSVIAGYKFLCCKDSYFKIDGWDIFTDEDIKYLRELADASISAAEICCNINQNHDMEKYLHQAKAYQNEAMVTDDKTIKLQKLGCAIHRALFVSCDGIWLSIINSDNIEKYRKNPSYLVAKEAYKTTILNLRHKYDCDEMAKIAYKETRKTVKEKNKDLTEDMANNLVAFVIIENHLDDYNDEKSFSYCISDWAICEMKERGIFVSAIKDKNLKKIIKLIDKYYILNIIKDFSEEEYSNIYIDNLKNNLNAMLDIKRISNEILFNVDKNENSSFNLFKEVFRCDFNSFEE